MQQKKKAFSLCEQFPCFPSWFVLGPFLVRFWFFFKLYLWSSAKHQVFKLFCSLCAGSATITPPLLCYCSICNLVPKEFMHHAGLLCCFRLHKANQYSSQENRIPHPKDQRGVVFAFLNETKQCLTLSP